MFISRLDGAGTLVHNLAQNRINFTCKIVLAAGNNLWPLQPQNGLYTYIVMYNHAVLVGVLMFY